MPPARRRPLPASTRPTSTRPHGRRFLRIGALFVFRPVRPDDHLAPQRQAQGGPPAPAPPRGALRRRGRGPRRRRRRGGLARRSTGCARASTSSPALLAAVSALGSGTRALAVYEQRWAAPAGPLCVALWGVRDPGNVGTVRALRAGLRRRVGRARPGLRRPVRPAGRARLDGRDLRRAGRARRRPSTSCPASGSRSSRAAASRCAARWPATRRSSSAPSAPGCPTTSLAACDRAAHIPIHSESLNAAMAATVALYEAVRHGGAPAGPPPTETLAATVRVPRA